MKLIKMEMTPKERGAAYARGEEVDRIPTALSANETATPLYGIPICDYYFSADHMVTVERGLAADFEADNMGMGLGLRTLPEALGVKLAYPKKSVSYIQEPAISDLSEVDNLEIVNIEKDGRLPIYIEAFSRLIEEFGTVRNIGSGLAGPFTTAASLIGTEKFLRATRKDKDGVHKLMQYATDCVVKCCEDFHTKLGLCFSLSEPIASGDLVSRKQFDEFFVPYLQQAVERMNKFQGATGLHICGTTHDRWEEVAQSGVSSFWVDNCESLKDLKDRYGSRFAIAGNVAPVELLRNGTKQELEAGIKKCLMDAADNPLGYRLCPGCTTPVGTSKESMINFMNAAAKYGRGAKKGCLPKGITEE